MYSDWNVCKGLWSGNVIACRKNSLTIKFFRDVFFEYWKKEKCLLCYFLIDCIIALGYENIENIKKEIDLVPINNSNTFELGKRLFCSYDENVNYFKKNNTYIYKLSYKLKNIEKNKLDGTTYEKIIIQGEKLI